MNNARREGANERQQRSRVRLGRKFGIAQVGFQEEAKRVREPPHDALDEGRARELCTLRQIGQGPKQCGDG